MKQKVCLKYINPVLRIGMVNLKEVYLLSPKIIALKPEVYKGRLIFRAKGSSRRFSYLSIKKGLLKTSKNIVEDVPEWM